MMAKRHSFDHGHSPSGGYGSGGRTFDRRSQSKLPQEELLKLNNRRARRLRAKLRLPEIELTTPEHTDLQHEFGNKELPAHQYKESIQAAVANHQVTIIVGETGSGKSTQIPQFLYESGYDVTITQPRIMAANGVAERVEQEMREQLGFIDASKVVGVHTSDRRTIDEDTKISVVTDGLRLAQDLGGRTSLDNEVLIIDEVHEWNTNIEIQVAWAKELVAKNPQMRVVLMSATMDAHKLAAYFSDATGEVSPVIEMEGRAERVDRFEKPQSTVVEEAAAQLAGDSDKVLIFVPGKREIDDTISALKDRLGDDSITYLPLHSKLSKEQQDKVYQSYPGKVVIVATNVAQTSLTIPDVDCVVDSGLERRIEIDDEYVSGLELHPVSQADCDQRAGRTGRTVPGVYILTRLSEESDFVPYIQRQKFPTPEIKRTDLARSVLRVAAYGKDFTDLDLYHPVRQDDVIEARRSLYLLGALDEDESITSTGRGMNKYPLRPVFGRMMVEAEQESQAVRSYMAAIVASVENGNLQDFINTDSKRWRQFISDDTTSDLMAQLAIFLQSQEVVSSGYDAKINRFAREYDLDARNIKKAFKQYAKIAKHAGVSDIHKPLQPPSQEEMQKIIHCIATGMLDFVYEPAGKDGKKKVYSNVDQESGVRREISDRSVVREIGNRALGLGFPYRIQAPEGSDKPDRHIIETITLIDKPALARAALSRSVAVSRGYEWRDNRLVEVREHHLHKLPLGIYDVRDAVWSTEVQDRLVQAALQKAGTAQQELRKIKTELERLHHMSSDVPVMTQDELIAYVRRAASDGVYELGHLDANLRAIMADESITLDSYVSAEKRQEIVKNSPKEVTLDSGVVVHNISYHNGEPRADNPYAKAHFLPDSVQTPDGREIRFVVRKPDGRGRSYMTARELKSAEQ